MATYYPPGHPYHRPEHDNTWWLNTSRGSNSSDSSSLGNTSSVGTLFSDSANSQDRNWKNGKVWTAVARGSDNGIRRGWSTSSSESCSSSRGGWINPCPSTEISSSSSGEDSRGASSRPSPGDQRPVTRQSVQTERVQRVANDIRAWGISTHNSLRAQEPNQPQPQDLDRLTARHWTRLGLQERQPGSAPVLRPPRFEPPPFNPAHSPVQPPAYTPGYTAGVFGGSAFQALGSTGGSASPAPRGAFGGSAFQALGSPGSTSPAPHGVFGGSAFQALGSPEGSASPAPRDLGAVPRRRRDY